MPGYQLWLLSQQQVLARARLCGPHLIECWFNKIKTRIRNARKLVAVSAPGLGSPLPVRTSHAKACTATSTQLTLPLYPSDSFIPEWASWIRALRRLASTPCFQTRPVLVFFFFVYLFVSVRPAHRRAKCGGAASWSRRAGSQRKLPSGGTDRRAACAGTAAGRAGRRFG